MAKTGTGKSAKRDKTGEGTIELLIILVVIGLIGFYGVSIYNKLVKSRQMVEEAWSGIDAQLKRRADLIPNLVETVKGYATHEADTFAEVTKMRTAAEEVPRDDVKGRGIAEGLLTQALGRLIAVAENYPDLKASANFAELQQALQTVEHEIQMSRRYYNGATRDLNVRVESFPSNLIANYFGFQQADYFEIDDPEDRSVPEVKF